MKSSVTAASKEVQPRDPLLLRASNDQILSSKAEARLISLKTKGRLRQLAGRKGLRRLISLSLLLGDVAALIIAFVLASIVRLGELHVSQVGTILAVSLPIYLMFALNNDAHNARVVSNHTTNATKALTAFALTASALMLIAFFLKIGTDFSRLLFGLGIVFSTVTLVAIRLGIGATVRRMWPQGLYANLCIYDDVKPKAPERESSIEARALGLRPDLGDSVFVSRLGEVAKGMDRIIIHCPEENRDIWAKAVKSLDVPSEIVVPELDVLQPLAIGTRSGHTSLLIGSGTLKFHQAVLKRCFDLAVCLVALPLLLPFFALVAVAIKLDSKGPVFFRQQRIGIGNRAFGIWKFRSMSVDKCDADGNVSTGRNDQRVTRVGRFIRRTSIDELPQLINVLVGEMSLVGPRPHALGSRAENQLFWEIDVRYWERHVVKPGLTGLAQIRGFRGATEAKEDLTNRLQADLEYVANWSLFGDIRITVATALTLLHKNAY